MLDKYIIYNEDKIIVGQDARTKEWFCKELPASEGELDRLIGFVNKTCNKYNKKEKSPPKTPSKKKNVDAPNVKGLN